MTFPRSLFKVAGALAILATAAPAAQAQIAWTDWLSFGPNSGAGTLQSGSNTVGVTYSGAYLFGQTGCGTFYFTNPNIYSSTGPADAPQTCDIIGLEAGGVKTITFTQAVVNPLIALVSWNGQPPVTFSGPLQVVAQGCGYWGCGAINTSGNDLYTSGEAHGTIRLVGSYTSFSFTDASEGWHGITIGAEAVATPEPSTYVLMATGLIGVFGISRRKRTS